MAAGDLGATDIFSPGSTWNVQNSSVSTSNSITEVLGSTGDIACLTPFQETATASAEYEGCGTPGLSEYVLGGVVGGYTVTSIEASQSAGEAPRLSIEGMGFDGGEDVSNNRTYSITQDFDISSVTGENVIDTSGEPTEISDRWEMQLTQTIGSDGQVSYVVSRTPKATYTESGIGTLGSAPSLSGWTLESWEDSDSNQETDTYTCTFSTELTSS